MFKKILGTAVVVSVMISAAAAANAETIAEYDFGKEVLRVQGEDFTDCEYDSFKDKISESTTWDGGKALRVNSNYDTLPLDDADGKLTYTYTINAPETANYNIMLQVSGKDANYHSQWTMELDGQAAEVKKTDQRTVDVTSIWYHTAKLTAGSHTLTINIPKAERGNNEGSTAGRFYFTLDYITLHNYYDIENDFSKMQMLDASNNNSAYGSGNEHLRFVDDNKNADRYAKMNISAPAAGYYVIDFEAHVEKHGSISSFNMYVNNEITTFDQMSKLAYGSSPNPVADSTRQFLRKYQTVVYLNEGVNELKFVSVKHSTNQWLMLDHLTVSTMPAPEADKVRVEGEHAYNAADIYKVLTHGSAKLIGYNEFNNGIALQTYGVPSDSSDVVLKYKVEAPETGAYNMGMMCSSAGSSFDIKINDVLLENVKSNSTRTENAIAMANSKAASDMYIYSYNNRVYLNKGTNEVEVIVKPRAVEQDYIIDLDYLDFNLKETGAVDPELSIESITYNGADSAPSVGTNSVEVRVKNISAFAAENTIVIVSVYDGDTFKAAYVDKPGTVAVNGTANASFSGVDYTEGNTVKIFTWQEDTLTPFTNAHVYTPAQ